MKKRTPLKLNFIILSTCVFFVSFCISFCVFPYFRTSIILTSLLKPLNQPSVSILMSTYNRSSILSEAIDSALNQTYKDFEFIIIDDGSKDSTADILKAYAKKDSRIIILTNTPNQGLIASLNKGLQHAQGKYIARLDDDDAMLPERLKKQVSFMERHPETAVLVTGYNYVKNKKIQSTHACPAPSDQMHLNMHFSNGIAHPTALFRSSFFKSNNITYNADFPSAEDYKLWQDIFWAGGSIDCLKEPLLDFKPHGSHKPDFYSNQQSSSQKIRRLYFQKLFNLDEKDLSLPSCILIKKMIAANDSKNILNKDLLNKKFLSECPKSDDYYFVTHPAWSDVLEKTTHNRYHRLQKKSDIATILPPKNNIITIQWDNWAVEKFKCTQKLCTFIQE